MNKSVGLILTAAIVLSLAGNTAANAQTSSTKTTKSEDKTTGKVSSTDKNFMNDVSQINLLEIKLGQDVQQKTKSADVKDFGQKMMTDHTQVQNDLKTLAGDKGVTVAETLNAANQQTFDKLNKLSGPKLDVAYIDAMVAGHRQAATLLKTEVSHTRDNDIKDFAKKTLAGVEEHLKLAKEVERKLSKTATASKENAKSMH